VTDNLFEQPTLAVEPSATVVEPSPVVDPAKNYVEELVGPDKKYKTTEDLARSNIHKDAYIHRLEQEARARNEDLSRIAKLEEVLERVTRSQPTPPPLSNGEHQVVREPEATVDIDKQIDKKLEERETVRTRNQNLSAVRSMLLQRYGENYTTKLREAAAKLDVGEKFLNDLAAANPKAFSATLFGALGERAVMPDAPSAPRSSVSSEAFRPSKGGKTLKDYQELRRTNPALYHSSKVQSEIWELAKKNPEEFLAD